MATQPPTFIVDVPGVGVFTFRRRTMRLEIAISAEYSRLTEGVTTPTVYLDLVSTWISTLKVLTAAKPEGWDVDAMDPLEDDNYTKLKGVFDALRAKEDEFRRPKAAVRQEPGEGDGQQLRVPVPPAVQPAADGPQVP